MKPGRIGLLLLLAPAMAAGGNPEILINAQGLAQEDLSIRGSSYTGAGVSINGLNLKVPFSAHYNAELPMYGPLFREADARTGINNLSGALIGTSALEMLPLESRSEVTLDLGTRERYRASTFGSSEQVGGFMDWEKARTIDYDANDLERFTAGAMVQVYQQDWRFDLLSAGRSKQYGAQGYYGIPSDIYAEERTDDGLLLAGAFKGDLDGSFMRAGLQYREFDREYLIPSAAFSSDVFSRYGSVMLEGRTLEIQHIALNLRGDLEQERVSGDTGNRHRSRGTVQILPEARFERITLTAGLNSVFLSDESPEWLPQAGAVLFLSDNLHLLASYSESVQQPDYQSLYYADPYHIGSTALAMQEMQSMELGLKQFLSATLDWELGLFHRRQEHAADWTKSTAADTAWTATDLGALDVTGIDAKLNYLAADRLKIELYYQWIRKDEVDLYAGLYELDYPEHLLGLSGYWQFLPEFQLFGTQVLRLQTDNNVRNSSNFGAEASLGLHYDPRFAKNVRLSFLVENLWDTRFQAIPGLKPRPISFSSGMSVRW